MRSQVITRLVDLESLAEAWDELSVGVGAPFTSPWWLIPWWRHAAPRDAQLCVVTVRADDGGLVGVAPYFVERDRFGLRKVRTLGAGASLYVEPVARPGHEEDVAAAIAASLAGLRPAPDYMTFEGVYERSPWIRLIERSWPEGRCWRHVPLTMPAPFIEATQQSYEEWFATKSKNFREQTRRRRRQLEKKGAVFRLATSPEEVDAGLKAFAELHHARWDPKGGSAVLTRDVHAMLPVAARELLPAARFRLWSIEIDDRVISSHLFVEAGGESAYWLGGFDPEWGSQQPALQTLIAAIEDGWARGDRRIDLGAGGQDYKYRLADEDVPVVWGVLVFPTPKRWLVRLRLGPYHLRRAVLNRMPDDLKDRIKSIVRRSS